MVRILLRFSEKIANQPITSQVILEGKIPINILSAYMNQQGGEILAEVTSEQAEKTIKAFRERGVIVDVRRLIEKHEEKCIDCGACVSLCPVGAIKLDENHTLELIEEKCNGVTCGLCIDSCPTRALNLIE